MKRLYIVAGIILALFVASAIVAAQPAQPVLVNGDFEAGFSVREAPEVEVANGWDYAYISGDDRWCRSPCSAALRERVC